MFAPLNDSRLSLTHCPEDWRVCDMATDSSAKYALINQLADELAARYRRGERPSLQEYLERYPELADDLRELFPAMAELEQAKEDRCAAGESGGAINEAVQQKEKG